VLGYEHCTQVQAQTLPVILKGHDVIAKAKTGTGKTIGFLLPTIELLCRAPTGKKLVYALAISPTRELAGQIKDECEALMTFHKPQLSCAYICGGTNIKADVRMLQSPPSLLVATPGRLVDLLFNYDLVPLFNELRMLIFDEADQLLEMGFRPSITQILSALTSSRATRQTLLFSATLMSDIVQVAQIATRGGEATRVVDTVGTEDKATHEHVPQRLTVTPVHAQTAELLALLEEVTQEPGYKVLVFFNTARLAGMFAELLTVIGGYTVLEMHSRKSQPHRTRMAEQFREGTNLVMLSSDVSARGMDYPDVTSVLQVGMPADRAQYIHRLGRTARAGKAGGGYLLLADFESGFSAQLKDLPIISRPPLSAEGVAKYTPVLQQAFKRLPAVTLSCAYQAYLGFYNSHLKRLKFTREDVVRRANTFATEVLLLDSPPALQAQTVGKMGLKGVEGLVVERGSAEGHRKGGGGKGHGEGGGKGKGGGKGNNSARSEGRGMSSRRA